MAAEAQLQKLIMDWLAAKHVLAFRMNTGAVKTEDRFFRFGVRGMADILAFKSSAYPSHGSGFISLILPVWIEVKAATRQSERQKSFQRQVEEAGHRYILAKSLADVEAVLG